jgi:hypothetical protein
MAKKLRPPQETKEIGIKRLKESYEKNNQTVCPPEKVREFEKLYSDDILKRVYDKK